MRRAFILMIVLLAVASAQWSEPILVTQDSGRHAMHEAVLLCAPGDTLLAFHNREFDRNDSMTIRVQWGLGDSWSAGVDLTPIDYWLGNLNPAVDPDGKLWLSWYHGSYPTSCPQWDSWSIYMTVRDSSGWCDPYCAIRPPFGATGQSFAAGREGGWYLGSGVDEAVGPGGNSDYPVYSCMYSRLLGDTWTTPRYIGRGQPIGEFWHYWPTLLTHPDSGVWTVHDHRWSEDSFRYRVIVNLVFDTLVQRMATLEGRHHAAAADSGRTLWVLFMNGEALMWAEVEENCVRRQDTITTDIIQHWVQYFPVYVCTDPLGWIWALWLDPDTVPVVAYNTGTGWSQPEVVCDTALAPLGMLSDSRGRIHVLLQTLDWFDKSVFSTYREYRPGIAEGRTELVRGRKGPTILPGPSFLPVGVRILDIQGREVSEKRNRLSPGVYFLRSAESGRRSAVQRVVIAR